MPSAIRVGLEGVLKDSVYQVWEIALPWPELPESAPELLEWFTAVLEKCASGASEGVESTPG